MTAPNLNSLTSHSKDKEDRLIIKALLKYKRPLSRRFLSEVLLIEISVLCRLLWNLQHKRKLITVSKIARCPKTGKRVYHYWFETPKPDLFTKSSNDKS
jgi:predicted transcriptional regulator